MSKEYQVNNIHTTDKDNLKEDFNSFKYRKMNCSFFKEVNSFKKNF